LIAAGIIEQLRNAGYQLCPICAYQAGYPGVDGFLPFGRIASHQDGFPEARRFLLNAATIGNDDMASLHETDKRQVVHRLDQEYAPVIAEDGFCGALYVGIQVNGIDDFDIFSFGDRQKPTADTLQTTVEIFPAMTGDQDHALLFIEK
jgi:hypothetical protein